MKIEFQWDEGKAASNLRKHNISFAEATEVFFDPRAVSYPDEFHSVEDERSITIGLCTKLRILLVVHTDINGIDGDVTIRIISARKATPKECTAYEKR
ncbi:MAG: hypothetical protein DMF62_14155 [Acidobacteria bacterium]|nr:MAG: hypothetical protein DMF62_14155 [Acidobacteriota bacterium]